MPRKSPNPFRHVPNGLTELYIDSKTHSGGTIRNTVVLNTSDYELVSPYRWYVSSQGYAVTDTERKGIRKRIWMHKLILPSSDGLVTDHINGNKLRNTRGNLRVCTPAQNRMNRRQMSTEFIQTSEYVGVSYDRTRRKYAAYAKSNGRKISLGYYDGEQEAALIRDQAVRSIRGDFGTYNFPVAGERSAIQVAA